MTKQEAIARATQQSIEHRCVQHVSVAEGPFTDAYYVSDWYDDDSTVFSIENGRELP